MILFSTNPLQQQFIDYIYNPDDRRWTDALHATKLFDGIKDAFQQLQDERSQKLATLIADYSKKDLTRKTTTQVEVEKNRAAINDCVRTAKAIQNTELAPYRTWRQVYIESYAPYLQTREERKAFEDSAQEQYENNPGVLEAKRRYRTNKEHCKSSSTTIQTIETLDAAAAKQLADEMGQQIEWVNRENNRKICELSPYVEQNFENFLNRSVKNI